MELDDNPGATGSSIDFRYYLAVLKKRWPVMLACAIVVTALLAFQTSRKPKIYQATATLIMDPSAPNVLGDPGDNVVDLGSGSLWSNAEYYNTQIRVLKSLSLARKVVTHPKYEFHRDERLMGPQRPGVSEDALVDQAARGIQGRISVSVGKESRVFSIQIRDTNPELAADIANAVQEVFIEQNLEVKLVGTRDAKTFVGDLLTEADKQLERSEKELYAFKEENKLLSVSWEDRQNLNSKALETFTDALNETKKRRIDLEARRRGVAKLLSEDLLQIPSGLVEESSALDSVRTTYMEERRKLRGLEERYGPKHEQVVQQQARVDEALTELKKETTAVLKSLDAQIIAHKEAESKYAAEIETLTNEALERNKKALAYTELSREAQQAEVVYKALLTRWHESSLQERDLANNIRPLDSARVPGAPVEPNMRSAVTMGLALGMLLAFALAFMLEMMDRSVKSQEDIEQGLALPFLGMVPSVLSVSDGRSDDGAPELHIARHQNSTVAECCRVVRTNIIFSSPDKPLRTMLVTSSNPAEGKTMTVINLGIVMAQNGHRTLLVDTDMRRPRLHKALGVPNDDGVSRLILGETELEAAVKRTDVPNLFVLPCGPHPPNPAELLQAERFRKVLELLQDKYDRVIFDSPPALAVTDAVVLSRQVEGCVLVVRAGRTTRDALRRAKQSIAGVGSRIIGVVLNDVDMKNPHYSSYYNYYHYRYHDNAPKKVSTAESTR